MSTSFSLEAKLVVLGSQSVGKTSLVHRYVKSAFIQQPQSTVGASFLTTRTHDAESGTTLRLQIWDTAGQERYRSISRLYYRGAQAALLCYDITNEKSFEDMARWLQELQEHCGAETIIHFVGTKTDVVAAAPEKRQVTFERCMEFAALQALDPLVANETLGFFSSSHSTGTRPTTAATTPAALVTSPISNRSSGFWAADHLGKCHEVSAKNGEGVEEVFRVLTRDLVEQHHKRQRIQEQQELQMQQPHLRSAMATPLSRGGPRTPGPGVGVDASDSAGGYFDIPGKVAFRPGTAGHGRRKSWLGFPTPGGDDANENGVPVELIAGRRGCC